MTNDYMKNVPIEQDPYDKHQQIYNDLMSIVGSAFLSGLLIGVVVGSLFGVVCH